MSKFKKRKNWINDNGDEVMDCPVCGMKVELDDICDHCGWQNTGRINIDGGPNDMTLEEAIRAYKTSK